MISGNKLYVLVNQENGTIGGHLNFGFGYDPETDEEPVPECSTANHELVPISEEDLGELTIEEFVASKKPVLVGGVFSSWTSRASAPSLALQGGIAPNDEGTLIATVNITGGPPSSTYVLGVPGPLKTDLTDNKDTLDTNGEGSFRIKALGGGGSTVTLTISPDGPQDFAEGSLEVTITKVSF